MFRDYKNRNLSVTGHSARLHGAIILTNVIEMISEATGVLHCPGDKMTS